MIYQIKIVRETARKIEDSIAIFQFKANEAEQIVINLSKTKLIET